MSSEMSNLKKRTKQRMTIYHFGEASLVFIMRILACLNEILKSFSHGKSFQLPDAAKFSTITLTTNISTIWRLWKLFVRSVLIISIYIVQHVHLDLSSFLTSHQRIRSEYKDSKAKTFTVKLSLAAKLEQDPTNNRQSASKLLSNWF